MFMTLCQSWLRQKHSSDLLLPGCINKRSIVLIGSTDVCDAD